MVKYVLTVTTTTAGVTTRFLEEAKWFFEEVKE